MHLYIKVKTKAVRIVRKISKIQCINQKYMEFTPFAWPVFCFIFENLQRGLFLNFIKSINITYINYSIFRIPRVDAFLQRYDLGDFREIFSASIVVYVFYMIVAAVLVFIKAVFNPSKYFLEKFGKNAIYSNAFFCMLLFFGVFYIVFYPDSHADYKYFPNNYFGILSSATLVYSAMAMFRGGMYFLLICLRVIKLK